MIAQARIGNDLKAAGLDCITALRAPAIKALREAGALQMSLFDQRDMAAITAPEFPGERLIVCRNQALAAERTRKREDLLAASERDIARIAAAVARNREPLRGRVEIGLEVGAMLDKHKMAEHFVLDINDTSSGLARKIAQISDEAALDGIYFVRNSEPAARFDMRAHVAQQKSTAWSSEPFAASRPSTCKYGRSITGSTSDVRAHVFLCMLAYYLE